MTECIGSDSYQIGKNDIWFSCRGRLLYIAFRSKREIHLNCIPYSLLPPPS
ncbi:hypothetical protein [Moorena sp. SIO3I8]|uniref:hypothetical protein n=1 Tax=Moorena sp. SIO3I8 TaxID=2607833 RepID=UPI0013C1C45F|nr:hypothetical protein [Moorena sp. SIO3I8]NEO07917.1 hypothetical protein [Moorena sp. SIO3I8]